VADFPAPTPRLRFRALVPEDAPELLRAFEDPDARRFYPAMADVAEVERWIERNLERYAEDGFGLWAVELVEGGELVGDCGLTLQDVDGVSELEVGWHVRADLRGRGLATEAGRACLAWGFWETDWPRIISLIHEENPASESVARKVHKDRLPELVERTGGAHAIWFTDRGSA
jgi:ribosomal-protein-alanine N-acetyltransferase